MSPAAPIGALIAPAGPRSKGFVGVCRPTFLLFSAWAFLLSFTGFLSSLQTIPPSIKDWSEPGERREPIPDNQCQPPPGWEYPGRGVARVLYRLARMDYG